MKLNTLCVPFNHSSICGFLFWILKLLCIFFVHCFSNFDFQFTLFFPFNHDFWPKKNLKETTTTTCRTKIIFATRVFSYYLWKFLIKVDMTTAWCKVMWRGAVCSSHKCFAEILLQLLQHIWNRFYVLRVEANWCMKSNLLLLQHCKSFVICNKNCIEFLMPLTCARRAVEESIIDRK